MSFKIVPSQVIVTFKVQMNFTEYEQKVIKAECINRFTRDCDYIKLQIEEKLTLRYLQGKIDGLNDILYLIN